MLSVFNQFVDAYNNRNLVVALDCFRAEPPPVAFGSGKDERRVGLNEIREQLQRDWNQSLTTKVKVVQINYEQGPDYGWVAAELNVTVGFEAGKECMPARMSVVMQKESEEHWKIAHMHLSLPAFDEPDGASFPLHNS